MLKSIGAYLMFFVLLGLTLGLLGGLTAGLMSVAQALGVPYSWFDSEGGYLKTAGVCGVACWLLTANTEKDSLVWLKVPLGIVAALTGLLSLSYL